jgi:uncharacterized membrane protein
MGIEPHKSPNYIYQMKLKGIVSRFNESGINRTNDLSCLLFVIFLLVSQLLYVRMVDKQDKSALKSQQHQIHEIFDY